MVEITSKGQNKVKRKKRTEDSLRDLWDNIKCTNIDSLRDLWDNIKCTNILILGVPEEEKKKGY